ncbi:hypothetical protein PXNS11_240029 [Stutzerimonas xanthomarina]|nr:hypothetical protein PXNS11_240029 [Stutzerimonas xanthomarina]
MCVAGTFSKLELSSISECQREKHGENQARHPMHRMNDLVLLGHKNGSITSHYSAAELGKLIDEANQISATDSRGAALTILRRKAG